MNIKLTKSDTQNLHLPSFRWLQNLQFSSNKWICFHALEHCVWMIVHIIAQHCCYSPQPKIYAQFFCVVHTDKREHLRKHKPETAIQRRTMYISNIRYGNFPLFMITFIWVLFSFAAFILFDKFSRWFFSEFERF